MQDRRNDDSSAPIEDESKIKGGQMMVPLMPDQAEIEEDEIIDHNDVDDGADFDDLDQDDEGESSRNLLCYRSSQ
jgi:hypothetical protein